MDELVLQLTPEEATDLETLLLGAHTGGDMTELLYQVLGKVTQLLDDLED